MEIDNLRKAFKNKHGAIEKQKGMGEALIEHEQEEEEKRMEQQKQEKLEK